MQADAIIVKNTVISVVVIIQETGTSACYLLEVNLKDLLQHFLQEKYGELMSLR
jgi:hypothetical protein